MRKTIIVFILIFLLCVPIPVSAQLYSIYWREDPGFQIMPIDENSPIVVEKGNIVFNFPDDQQYWPDAMGFSSWLTMNYTLYNPTDEMQNVQIALPVISELGRFNPNSISVGVDGNIKEPHIFIGEDRGSILDSGLQYSDYIYNFINDNDIRANKEYLPKNYSLNDKGILYTYDVHTSEEDMYLTMNYIEDKGESFIVDGGFNSYQYNGEIEGPPLVRKFSRRINKQAQLSNFIIGEDVDFSINAFLDYAGRVPTNNYDVEINRSAISLGDYFDILVNEYMSFVEITDYLTEEQIKNMIMELWDEIWERRAGTSVDGLLSFYNDTRMIYCTFDVDIPANSRKHVSIGSTLKGSINSRKTLKPVYEFKYDLSSLNRWADFGQISIGIDAPRDNPYVIESNLDFTSKETGFYTGRFDELPGDELSFTLYYKEKISRWDRIKRFFYDYMSLIGLSVTLLIAGIKYIIRKHKKKPDMDS